MADDSPGAETGRRSSALAAATSGSIFLTPSIDPDVVAGAITALRSEVDPALVPPDCDIEEGLEVLAPEGNTPRWVGGCAMRIPAPGATDAERATSFVASHRDLVGVSDAAAELTVRSVKPLRLGGSLVKFDHWVAGFPTLRHALTVRVGGSGEIRYLINRVVAGAAGVAEDAGAFSVVSPAAAEAAASGPGLDDAVVSSELGWLRGEEVGLPGTMLLAHLVVFADGERAHVIDAATGAYVKAIDLRHASRKISNWDTEDVYFTEGVGNDHCDEIVDDVVERDCMIVRDVLGDPLPINFFDWWGRLREWADGDQDPPNWIEPLRWGTHGGMRNWGSDDPWVVSYRGDLARCVLATIDLNTIANPFADDSHEGDLDHHDGYPVTDIAMEHMKAFFYDFLLELEEDENYAIFKGVLLSVAQLYDASVPPPSPHVASTATDAFRARGFWSIDVTSLSHLTRPPRGAPRPISFVVNDEERLHVFYRCDKTQWVKDGICYNVRTPTTGWSSYVFLDTPTLNERPSTDKDPAVALHPDGRLFLFWRDKSTGYLRAAYVGLNGLWQPYVDHMADTYRTGRAPSAARFDGSLWVGYVNRSGMTRYFTYGTYRELHWGADGNNATAGPSLTAWEDDDPTDPFDNEGLFYLWTTTNGAVLMRENARSSSAFTGLQPPDYVNLIGRGPRKIPCIGSVMPFMDDDEADGEVASVVWHYVSPSQDPDDGVPPVLYIAYRLRDSSDLMVRSVDFDSAVEGGIDWDHGSLGYEESRNINWSKIVTLEEAASSYGPGLVVWNGQLRVANNTIYCRGHMGR